jgi:hypothetical protein
VPSNKPLSDNFKEGITNNAMKDKLMYGALSLLPICFAMVSNSAYDFPISSADKSDIIPATGNETIFSSDAFTAQTPPLFSVYFFGNSVVSFCHSPESEHP